MLCPELLTAGVHASPLREPSGPEARSPSFE